jgi:hypothetical protein
MRKQPFAEIAARIVRAVTVIGPDGRGHQRQAKMHDAVFEATLEATIQHIRPSMVVPADVTIPARP